MNIEAYAYFAAVYRERSIRKASEILFISQQGLSKIILQLEEEYGVVLFERLNTGLVPTRAGHCLYQNIQPLLENMDVVRTEMTKVAQGGIQLDLAFRQFLFRLHSLTTLIAEECNDNRRQSKHP